LSDKIGVYIYYEEFTFERILDIGVFCFFESESGYDTLGVIMFES